MSAPTPRALAAYLTSAISESRAEAELVVLPVPRLDPLALLRAARKGDAWWLERADEDESLLAIGELRATALAGTSAALSAHHATRPMRVTAHPDAEASLVERLPVTVFGHAFASGASEEDPWRHHQDGRAVTPRWTYLARGDRAVLAFACEGPSWPGRAALIASELEMLLAATRAPRASRPGVVIDPWSPGEFLERVESARSAIRRGELTKVVCSRRASVTADGDLEPEEVLARLSAPSGLRFLVRRGSSTLIGATPERLFRKTGLRAQTEALAGTRAQGSSEQALLASAKDQAEHAPVVEAIVERLERLGARVCREASPELRRVANVVHLRTAIEAALPEQVEASALLAALHPTPAVGGTPRAAAEAFVRANEPPRGWYAGPLGWIDARGDADVHVMLRCAVIRGARAWVFAGGGIVASSDPSAELAETELKMAPMLRALGVPVPRDEVRGHEAHRYDATHRAESGA